MEVSDEAIAEVEEQADYRENGPKDHVRCPDCGSIFRVRQLEAERYELDFVSRLP